ncbi:hypothetical protein LXL04_015940 [Taraxacum kok-saghyz]
MAALEGVAIKPGLQDVTKEKKTNDTWNSDSNTWKHVLSIFELLNDEKEMTRIHFNNARTAKAIRYTPSVVGVVPTWRRVKGVHTTPEGRGGRGRGETVFRTTD